jgi:hypothetical protein
MSTMRGVGLGSDDGDAAFAACRDSIFDSARLPAPMTMQGRAVSLRKMGKRDMARYSPGAWRPAPTGGASRSTAGELGSGELGAEAVVVGAGEVGAQVFAGLARGEIGAQQALDGLGAVLGGGAVADLAGDARRTCRPLRRRRSRRRRPSCRPS